MSKHIVFIHGVWVTPMCWEQFVQFFEAHGYTTEAPPWPYKDKSVAEQQQHPDPRLATLSIQNIVDHYAAIISAMKEPPIIMGHSLGGLIVQMLLDRGLGSAGVALASAPPKGVFALYPNVLKRFRSVLCTPFLWKRLVRFRFKDFSYVSDQVLTPDLKKKAYARYVVPDSGRVFWDMLTAPFTHRTYVNFKNNNRSPLLMIAGENDRIVPIRMIKHNYKKYKKSQAVTDFKTFPSMFHWLNQEPGWEDVATYVDHWIINHNAS